MCEPENALGWRVLVALEGGAALLAAAAVLARAAARRAGSTASSPPATVLISDTSNELGEELKQLLEARGCTVSTVTSGAGAEAEADKVDALVIVGAEAAASGLGGLADLVSEDVYSNLKLLDNLTPRVRSGGRVVWAAAGTGADAEDAFSAAASAFDHVLRASLQHAAKTNGVTAVWVGRESNPTRAAAAAAAALLPRTDLTDSFSIRNAAFRLTDYVGRRLKIIS